VNRFVNTVLLNISCTALVAVTLFIVPRGLLSQTYRGGLKTKMQEQSE